MAIALVTQGQNYYGLSGDTKPPAPLAGARFHETDTGAIYIWTGTAWALFQERML